MEKFIAAREAFFSVCNGTLHCEGWEYWSDSPVDRVAAIAQIVKAAVALFFVCLPWVPI